MIAPTELMWEKGRRGRRPLLTQTQKRRPTVAPNQSVVYIPLSYTLTNLPNQV